MPAIRVDEDVYAYLGSLARPFEDTPNTVLRRILHLDEGPDDVGDGANEGPGEPQSVSRARRPSTGRSVQEMRDAATEAVVSALANRSGGHPTLTQEPAAIGRRGPQEQRYMTPNKQVLYLRTRSFDLDKLPFFTMQPTTLDDADWYIFVCDRRGDVVMPGALLRELAPGLHRDRGGDYKPTFILDDDRCDLYCNGVPTTVMRWLNAYPQIAEVEHSLTLASLEK